MTQAACTIPARPEANDVGRTPCPDAALASRAANNAELFAPLYRRHFEPVAGYLLRRTGNAALAEDLAADTFLAAWKALPGYQDSGIPFRAWLLRIATNRANAAARRERVRRRVFSLLARPAVVRPTDSQSSAYDTDHLYTALARLHPEHQTVIALVHLEGLSVAHTARILDVAEGTVKSRLHRAREALKRELARTGGRP